MINLGLLSCLIWMVSANEAVVNHQPAGFNQSSLLPPAGVAQPMPEAKKIESWLPSQFHQPEVHHQPQQLPVQLPYPVLPNPPAAVTQPQPQPFFPDNYFLPPASYPAPPSYPPAAYPPANNYAPLPTTEFRSEHYPYPFEPPNYGYPVSQPPMDTSLIPTAKHFVIVSFIGLLLLFAIIQNSIAAAKRKDALVEVLSNRKKRDLGEYENYVTTTPDVYSLKDDPRVRCIQRTLCFENRKLYEDLGIFGKLMAKYLTRTVQRSLKDLSPEWDRLIEEAANVGLRRENCNVVYRDCDFQKLNDTSTVEEESEEEEPA